MTHPPPKTRENKADTDHARNVIDIFALHPQPDATDDKTSKAQYYQRILQARPLPSYPISSHAHAPSAKGVPRSRVDDKGGDGDADADAGGGGGDADWRTVKKDGIGKLYRAFGAPSQDIRSIIGAKG